MSNFQKNLGKGLGWITDSVVGHTIKISKYNSSVGSSYIKFLKKLDYTINILIDILNINDNECFMWFLVRYVHPTDHNPRRIIKVDKLYGDKLDFRNIKFLVKVRDIHKIERTNSIGISVFGYENKKKYQIYVSKNIVKINMLIYH